MSTNVAERVPPLVLTEGGPGDALLRFLRLAPLGQRTRRAALVLAAIAWVPLLVLSAVAGLAVGGLRIPFLYDFAPHVRFLVAVPVLMLAEIPIGMRLRQVVSHFVETGLVRSEEQPRFTEIILRTARLRDSRVAELVVLAAAYVTAYGMLASSMERGGTWHTPDPTAAMTPAGYWYVFVSVPIFQFLLYRWLYRMVVWARFLRAVSELDLQLTPTHPDGAGGLGFVGKGCVPFGALLFAVSAVAASTIATRVLYAGSSLQSFRVSYAALFAVAFAVFAGPALAFVPTLAKVKQKGLLDYGTLASRYTQRFERKWVQGGDANAEELLGTGDIQSLADLNTSYELVKKMRTIPIELRDLVAMAVPGLLPAIALAATVMPVSEIMKGLLRLLV